MTRSGMSSTVFLVSIFLLASSFTGCALQAETSVPSSTPAEIIPAQVTPDAFISTTPSLTPVPPSPTLTQVPKSCRLNAPRVYAGLKDINQGNQ